MKERTCTFTAAGSDGKPYIVDVVTNYINGRKEMVPEIRTGR